MTIINGSALLRAAPLSPMLATKERAHGVSHGLSEAGYDLRIRQAITFKRRSWMGGPRVSVDGKWGMGSFTLASTVERFQMPCDLVGVVHDKSTWARQGLSVFNTVVEPGWSGWLTLELVYYGEGELHIPAGSGIAQVLFHELAEPADYGNGKYQGQADRPVPAIMEG